MEHSLTFECVLQAALLGYILMLQIDMCADSEKNKLIADFRSMLDMDQTVVLNAIVKERAEIFFESLVIGVIVSIISCKMFMDCQSNTCAQTCVFLVSTAMAYQMFPKSTYMVKHLKSKEQVDAWFDATEAIKNASVTGAIYGVLLWVVLTSVI